MRYGLEKQFTEMGVKYRCVENTDSKEVRFFIEDRRLSLVKSKRLRVSMDQRKTGLNRHVLTVAASGAGKTRCMLLNNLVQMNSSYIVLDVRRQ